MDPIKYMYKAPSLIGKLAKWLILLFEFNVEYLSKKIVKGRVVVEFLALNPINDDEEIELDLPYNLSTTIEVWG